MLRRCLWQTLTAPVKTSSSAFVCTGARCVHDSRVALRQAPRNGSGFGSPPPADQPSRHAHSVSSSQARDARNRRRAVPDPTRLPSRGDSRWAERENGWRQFNAAMSGLQSAMLECAGSADSRRPLRRPHGDTATTMASGEEFVLRGGSDWVDPATTAVDPDLLASLGVTDLEVALGEAEDTDHQSSLLAPPREGDVKAQQASTDEAQPSILEFSPHQSRELRPLTARACQTGLRAGVAPAVIVQRVLEAALMLSNAGEAPSRIEDKESVLPRFVVQPGDEQTKAQKAQILLDQRIVLTLFADPTVAALLDAEAQRLSTQVEWGLQRLRDSRSPAANAELKWHEEGEYAQWLLSCGEPTALHYQLLKEHATAEQLLSFFTPRIIRETAPFQRAAEASPASPGSLATIPQLHTLEAGLRLCAAMQGGQGAQRAARWVRSALSCVEELIAGRVTANEEGSPVDPTALLDLVRGRLVDCCCAALQAAATGEGADEAGTSDNVTFESSYALMMRCMSVLQQASDLAASADPEDVSAADQTSPDASMHVPLQNTLSNFADATLKLYAPLADSLIVRGHAQHFASLRAMLTTLLAETDVGYNLETVSLVQQCYRKLLCALAHVNMDSSTRHTALEELCRTVTLNSRSEVWQSEAVNAQVLHVLSTASVSNSIAVPDGSSAEEATAAAERESSLRQQRTVNVFNALMEPSSRDKAFRENVLGPVTLCASIACTDDDVQRFLSYAAQRYPISMDTAHALAVKLLLKDALVHHQQEQRGATDTATPCSASLYTILELAVSAQRKQRDVQASRTFFLRLLVFYRDLATATDGANSSESASKEHQEARDDHAAATLSAWLAALDEEGVKTLPALTIDLLAATAAHLRQHNRSGLPRSLEKLEREVQARAEGLLHLHTAGTIKGPQARFLSASHGTDPDAAGAQRHPVLSFPSAFAVAGCIGSSSPWTNADAHAFLSDVRTLLKDTKGCLLLRDYCTLMKLHCRAARLGFTTLDARDDFCYAIVPPWEEGELATSPLLHGEAVNVEGALGTTLPRSLSLDTGLSDLSATTGTQPSSLVERWLGRLMMDLEPADGEAVLGGGNTGLSTQPLFPSFLRHVLLPTYHREKQKIKAMPVEAKDALPVSEEKKTKQPASAAPNLADEVFTTIAATP